jgi:hypothetical protein
VQHLCLVEARVTKELEKAIARGPRRVGFFRRFIPTSVVALRFTRVKAPEAMNPWEPPTLDRAIENFDHARDKLKALCAAHGTERFRNLVFKHPFLGEIDVWPPSRLSAITNYGITSKFVKCLENSAR